MLWYASNLDLFYLLLLSVKLVTPYTTAVHSYDRNSNSCLPPFYVSGHLHPVPSQTINFPFLKSFKHSKTTQDDMNSRWASNSGTSSERKPFVDDINHFNSSDSSNKPQNFKYPRLKDLRWTIGFQLLFLAAYTVIFFTILWKPIFPDPTTLHRMFTWNQPNFNTFLRCFSYSPPQHPLCSGCLHRLWAISICRPTKCFSRQGLARSPRKDQSTGLSIRVTTQ